MLLVQKTLLSFFTYNNVKIHQLLKFPLPYVLILLYFTGSVSSLPSDVYPMESLVRLYSVRPSLESDSFSLPSLRFSPFVSCLSSVTSFFSTSPPPGVPKLGKWGTDFSSGSNPLPFSPVL